MKASFLKAGIRFMVIACAISLTALSAAAQQTNATARPAHPNGPFMKAVLALHLSAQQQRSVDAYAELAHKNNVATIKKMRSSIMNVLTPEQRNEVRAKLHKSSQTSLQAPAPSPDSGGIWVMHRYTSKAAP